MYRLLIVEPLYLSRIVCIYPGCKLNYLLSIVLRIMNLMTSWSLDEKMQYVESFGKSTHMVAFCSKVMVTVAASSCLVLVTCYCEIFVASIHHFVICSDVGKRCIASDIYIFVTITVTPCGCVYRHNIFFDLCTLTAI